MLQPGARIGGYRIVRLLGRGGMGHVFEATELALDRPVALKILSNDLASDAQFRGRFEHEGRVQAQLDHAHIVKVHAAGEANGHLYIAMHLVRGPTLKELIANGDLGPHQAIRLLTQVASALDVAHADGVTHRDVKPRNVLVGPNDHAYLADFGLTKKLSESAGFTRTGQLMGTIDYISPEQIDGHSASAASDIYSLAAIVFEALTGSVPFPRDSEPAVLFAHMSSPPPLVSALRPDLPAAVDAPVAQGLAKDPAERPATATALLDATATALGMAPLASPERTAERRAVGDSDPGGGRPRVLRRAFTDADFPPTMEPGSRLVPPESDPALAVPDHVPPELCAAPATPRAEPARTPAPARRFRRRAAVLTGGAAALAAVAGFLLGGHGTKQATAEPPPLSNSAGNGAIAIAFPTGWHQRTTSPTGRVLGLDAPIAVTGDAHTALVAGVTTAATPQLLAPVALKAVSRPLPAPVRVKLGGLAAYRYRDVRLRNASGITDVLVAPTTVGVVTLACTREPGATSAAIGDCARIAESVRLQRGAPTTLGPDGAYAVALRHWLTRLDRARVRARKALSAAAGPLRQAAAAREAARAYRAAASAIRGAATGRLERAANTALAAALARGADGYRALDAAAIGGHRARFGAAAAEVRQAERAVRAALDQLPALGYRFR